MLQPCEPFFETQEQVFNVDDDTAIVWGPWVDVERAAKLGIFLQVNTRDMTHYAFEWASEIQGGGSTFQMTKVAQAIPTAKYYVNSETFANWNKFGAIEVIGKSIRMGFQSNTPADGSVSLMWVKKA